MTKSTLPTVKKQLWLGAWSYVCVILAAIVHAFNYQLFIVNNGFAPAGLNGIATMIQYKTGFSIGYMSLIINIPLCVLAYFLVDRAFAKRSLTFCLTYSFVFLFLQKLGLEQFQYNSHGHDTIFPVLLSGVLAGLVYGMCFRVNGSTGGTDIISKYISKKKRELNFFWVTFVLNATVAIISFFVYATENEAGQVIYNYKPVCQCVMFCFISSFIGNYIIKGFKTACKFTVITSHADEITADIFATLKHGATQITAVGSYKHEEKTMLICVVNKHQIVDFETILRKYDNTFSFCEMVNETYGNFVSVK